MKDRFLAVCALDWGLPVPGCVFSDNFVGALQLRRIFEFYFICRSYHVKGIEMEKGSSLVSGLTQLRGVVAILQWWGFNVLVIIMNKWIFQVGDSVFWICSHVATIFQI